MRMTAIRVGGSHPSILVRMHLSPPSQANQHAERLVEIEGKGSCGSVRPLGQRRGFRRDLPRSEDGDSKEPLTATPVTTQTAPPS
jgi:hypothetical protein